MAFSVFWYLKPVDQLPLDNFEFTQSYLYRRCQELLHGKAAQPGEPLFGWVKPRGNVTVINLVARELETFQEYVVESTYDDYKGSPEYEYCQMIIGPRHD